MPLLTTSSGPIDYRYETVAPAVAAQLGSVALRIDAGNVGAFINVDGLVTGWRQFITAGGTTTFGTVDMTWLIPDNSATSWTVGSTGAPSLMVFDTLNGAEQLHLGFITIDTDSQATDVSIRDNVSAALRITSNSKPFISITTLTNSAFIDLGMTPSATGVVASLRMLSPGYIELNGIDYGTRLVVDEPFLLRPDVAGNVANADANKNICVIGVNNTAWTFAAGGGVTATTNVGAGSQQCLRGQTAGNQGIWSNTTWSTNDEVRFKCNIRTSADITSQIIAAGLKLTLVADATLFNNATDADQVYFGYATDNRYAVNATDFIAVIRIGGNSTNATTAVVVGASSNYRLVIDISSTRIARFYINGVLVATSTAITAGVSLLPFVGIEGVAAARALTVQKFGCSKVYA